MIFKCFIGILAQCLFVRDLSRSNPRQSVVIADRLYTI